MDKVLRYGFVAVLLGGVGGWYRWSQRSQHGKILIDVTRGALTVSKRPGDVYPFSDAKLGVWGVSGGMTMGTTLHLHCGQRRFVLGGRDYRVAAGTRLEAPDAGYGQPVDVDAWVAGTDFGEILTMAGRQSSKSRLDASPLAPAEPTRCLLFPSPLAIQQMGPFAFRQKQQLLQSVNQPRLAIDVGPDAIRVIDPNTNALIASARLAFSTPTKSASNQPGWFAKAVIESGVPRTTPHDLRHTAASLAVSAGANVKAVQKMLGPPQQ
jgi:hypothetical protein